MTDEELDDLQEWLIELHDGDHERGCDGRTYRCSCNYDAHVIEALDKAAAAIRSLRAKATALDAQRAEERFIKTGDEVMTPLGLGRIAGPAWENEKTKRWWCFVHFNDGRTHAFICSDLTHA